ncbi:MAG: methyltransferase domain-containing protein [Anaerolineae bacterium]|nr:methyltransferase domain-containing protein [Anaerolineae bacterium]
MTDQISGANHSLPTDDAQTRLIALVGQGQRVLLVGDRDEDLTTRLQANGCQVISLRDEALDSGEMEQVVGGEAVDVVVAVRCLEHLKDPLAGVTRLRPLLKADGRLVAIVPNIAHGSIRLALLGGHFPLSEAGWQAAAPLRFFTRASLERLLEEGGFVVGRLERLTRPFDLDGLSAPPSLVPPGLLETLRHDPEALTYQFIVVAHPLPHLDLQRVQARMRELTDAREAAELRLQALEQQLAAAQAQVQALQADNSALERENAALKGKMQALRETLDQQAADLETLSRQVTLSPQREVALRQGLLEAHDQLLQRDEELIKLRQQAANAVETVRWMQASRSWQMIQKSWMWRQQVRRLLKPGKDKA